MNTKEWTNNKAPRREWVVVLATMIAVTTVGCEPRQISFGSPSQVDRQASYGLVIYLPGIDGCTGADEKFCRDLGKKLGCDVELFDWTRPLMMLDNQCNIERNREMAEKLAQRIRQFQEDNPGAPVLLIGHSGGTAIAVWAAEHLSDEPVDGIILLASSLSPQYDLSAAMEGTRSGIISFYSQNDGLLGAGTILAGTMDRKFSEAAGKLGFEGPEGQKDLAYAGQLRQVPWTSEMASLGNNGGHYDVLASQFAATWVHPLVRQKLPGGPFASNVEAPTSWPVSTALAAR